MFIKINMSDAKSKHAGGRPRKYQTVEELQKAIDFYFNTDDHYTVTGLALSLGFTSRQALIVNEGYSPEFFDALKTAKLKVENFYEKHLTANNATGSIFALKNFRWQDKQITEHIVDEDTANLLGMIDGSSKAKLPDSSEAENTG